MNIILIIIISTQVVCNLKIFARNILEHKVINITFILEFGRNVQI